MEPTPNVTDKSTIVGVIVVLAVLVLGVWYWYSASDRDATNMPTAPAPAPITPEATVPAPAPTLSLGTSDTLGNYLVAKSGMTLYRYTKDTKGVSNCFDTCAENWPPYTIAPDEVFVGDPTLMLKTSLILRLDGTNQLAYDGIPLYFWKDDSNIGDTNGQNVGGVWFIVQP
jgi:predicted lipoprotein with Yx(FWY)xxD motif